MYSRQVPRQKLIKKKSENYTKRRSRKKIGRLSDLPIEKEFLQEVKQQADTLNLELRVQLYVYLLSNYSKDEGTPNDNLISELSLAEEERRVLTMLTSNEFGLMDHNYFTYEDEQLYTSNIDCRFMVAWLIRKKKLLWNFNDFIAVIIAMLKWKRLINVWSVRFFNDLLRRPERFNEMKYSRLELYNSESDITTWKKGNKIIPVEYLMIELRDLIRKLQYWCWNVFNGLKIYNA